MEDPPTPSEALKFSFELRRTEKYFAAQKILERALEQAVLAEASQSEATLLGIADELGQLVEDYRPEKRVFSADYFLVLGSLADLHLLQGHTLEALSFSEAALKSYAGDTGFNQEFLVNVVFHALLGSCLRVMYSLLGQKKLGLMARTVKLLNRLDEWLDGQNCRVSERVLLAVGYFNLLQFSWFGDEGRQAKATVLLDQVHALEAKIVLAYYNDPDAAKAAAYELVAQNPSSSMNWTWLGILETDPNRAFNALKQALALDAKNYVAWTSLSAIQANENLFEESAKSWVVSHKFNHTNPALWLMSSFFNKILRQMELATEHFKLAIDIDPTLVFVQLREEFEALG
mmetsp:Transcript_15778/g.28823  ORF Transcript_15778/g.28823 Transcript_15778/m.28823 type:complete len:345 (+) Transcript_15778:844-1878(+)|eukprot:CAMPEP_0204913896 /NCGR_PEP_ID=MMETSP1397-20131031/11752_1 /ASSEMBLY_ACC=CAM_ASM_000891 /TAXON_ID=49980 /ORGANISM="Climacostomum Climacostomum virens, Strain Stock W-24" /LENGTH=344 /DNA_ID=CAMNT_0052085249 /DNA_START=12 /DNA_END=1046 /DNA_ORIENTATION=-